MDKSKIVTEDSYILGCPSALKLLNITDKDRMSQARDEKIQRALEGINYVLQG